MTVEKYTLESGRLWQLLLDRSAEHGARTSLLNKFDLKNPEHKAWLKQSTADLRKLNAEIKAQVALLTAQWPEAENHQRMLESNAECMDLAMGVALHGPRNTNWIN